MKEREEEKTGGKRREENKGDRKVEVREEE